MIILDITEIIIALAALFSAIVAFRVAFLTRDTLKETRNMSYADILLRLDESFKSHEEVREKLIDGGEWHRKEGDSAFPKGPNYENSKDKMDIGTYMGLFERIQKLIERQIITIDEFDAWYGDRFMNIVMNSKIKARLDNPIHKKGWSGFIDLGKDLVKQRKQFSHRWVPEDALLPDELKSN